VVQCNYQLLLALHHALCCPGRVQNALALTKVQGVTGMKNVIVVVALIEKLIKGGIIVAVVITNRKPLELLQVKE